MKHRKRVRKLGRTSSHYGAMMANLLKSLILHEVIQTSLQKAKHLRRYADRMITLAKKGTLASRRRAIAKLRISFNSLSPKEQRRAKAGDLSAYNDDRKIIKKLFTELSTRYTTREGGYTRVVPFHKRKGDNAKMCLIEYLPQRKSA